MATLLICTLEWMDFNFFLSRNCKNHLTHSFYCFPSKRYAGIFEYLWEQDQIKYLYRLCSQNTKIDFLLGHFENNWPKFLLADRIQFWYFKHQEMKMKVGFVPEQCGTPLVFYRIHWKPKVEWNPDLVFKDSGVWYWKFP